MPSLRSSQNNKKGSYTLWIVILKFLNWFHILKEIIVWDSRYLFPLKAILENQFLLNIFSDKKRTFIWANIIRIFLETINNKRCLYQRSKQERDSHKKMTNFSDPLCMKIVCIAGIFGLLSKMFWSKL
jgi:hypothetical protein